jgi:hypothetical protein
MALCIEVLFSHYSLCVLLPLLARVVRSSKDMTHATVELITFFVKGKATRLQP